MEVMNLRMHPLNEQINIQINLLMLLLHSTLDSSSETLVNWKDTQDSLL